MNNNVHAIGYGVVGNLCSNMYLIIFKGTLSHPHMTIWSMHAPNSSMIFSRCWRHLYTCNYTISILWASWIREFGHCIGGKEGDRRVPKF
jgi:hypothetical protein